MVARFLRSEWIKLKRISLRWVVFAFFVIHSVLVICYSKRAFKYDDVVEEMYWQFFMILGGTLPIFLSFYIGIMNLMEKKAGNFKNITASPLGKIKIFICRNILVNVIFSPAIMLSTILYVWGINIVYQVKLPVDTFLIGALCVCFSCISLTAIYTAIAFYYSLGTVLAVGVFGTIIGAIFSVSSLGSIIWRVIPFTYYIVLPINYFYIFPSYVYSYMINLLVCIFTTFLVFITALCFFKKAEK
jgi:ABC-2 type transport system permease protein